MHRGLDGGSGSLWLTASVVDHGERFGEASGEGGCEPWRLEEGEDQGASAVRQGQRSSERIRRGGIGVGVSIGQLGLAAAHRHRGEQMAEDAVVEGVRLVALRTKPPCTDAMRTGGEGCQRDGDHGGLGSLQSAQNNELELS